MTKRKVHENKLSLIIGAVFLAFTILLISTHRGVNLLDNHILLEKSNPSYYDFLGEKAISEIETDDHMFVIRVLKDSLKDIKKKI